MTPVQMAGSFRAIEIIAAINALYDQDYVCPLLTICIPENEMPYGLFLCKILFFVSVDLRRNVSLPVGYWFVKIELNGFIHNHIIFPNHQKNDVFDSFEEILNNC